MRELAERLLSRSRKKWWRTAPVFAAYAPVKEEEFPRIEGVVHASLPDDLKAWLLQVGYGDIDANLSFRYEWFKSIEQGSLRGAVLFAQDILGNLYAFVPEVGDIIFFSRSSSEFAVLAPTFRAFMEELERRDYKVLEWAEAVPASAYDWDAPSDKR
jgi:hypothetical protein